MKTAMRLVLGAVTLAAVLVCDPAGADEAAKSKRRWMLGMTHGPLRTVVIRDAAKRSRAYHYMTVTVTNGTPLDRRWHPLAKAITDTGKTYIAGGFTQALGTIREREGNSKLVPIGSTAGKLGAGKTVTTVALFGPLDSLYDRVTVEIYGLVDPIAIYKVEQYGEKSPAGARGDKCVVGPRTVIVDSAYWERNQRILAALKKEAAEAGSDSLPSPGVEYMEVAEVRYFAMVYERLGDEFHAEDDVISFVSEGWRVRGTPKGLRVITTEGG